MLIVMKHVKLAYKNKLQNKNVYGLHARIMVVLPKAT